EQGSLLQYWGGEIKREPFKLSLLKRRGRDNIGTIRYGKDLSGLKVKLDWTGVKTRIIPYADPQSDTGTTSRIYGSPVDSEYINNYPDVYTEHVQFTEEQGVKDVNSLNKIAKNYFKTINPGCDKPKISISVEFDKLTDTEEGKEFAKIRNYGLFDTFKIYHRKYKLYFESKVSGVQYDSLSEKVLKLEAGDTQVAFYQQQAVSIQDKLKDYATNNYMSSFNDYVSSMITGQGNAGGYVVLWPKEKPSNIFIMDNPDLNKAKEVLRMNKNGIAFSKNGWNGPFNSAWTLDSIFNANFIKTGIIDANVFQNSFNKTGDVLRLVNGLLEIWNNRQKIMQLSKTGMEFFFGGNKVGGLTTIGNPFPEIILPEGQKIEGNSVFVTTTGKNRFIGLSAKEGTGIIVGMNQLFMIQKRLDMIIDKVQLTGRLDVKELYVNGVKIDKNGGGSGGSDPGTIPPQLTTEAEKRAWKIWTMLKARGYSEYAAAGILGNIQGEVGASMNPDTEQVGGPAYGLVQWDGSAYPLVGSPTWNGREYVQRLMNTAGIQEDYQSIEAQVKLLDWCMFNGQWIGKVNPTTVSGFKTINDAKSAAYAFEMNFERPASAHPERQNYAQAWYDKLHGLTSPEPGGNFICPIQKPVTVTSECGWRKSPINNEQEFHNGIDLINGNPNTPIFAALDGEVVQAGANYYDWYGNYVVIKHNNGKWTGYAHLSRIDVSVGQKVQKGAQIGLMGTTGPSTGEHLHFQIMKNYWPQPVVDFENPRNYIQF
ncbi:peptidoglycan DD-metalloendopeptidase family protein, partial [Enterococcus hirae]|nr:peptidoglycan DD-metalloendopeptidase family protein [Enterococcus hirae]